MDFISPLPLADEDRPYREGLHAALVGELLNRSKVTMVFLVLTLVLIWKVLGKAAMNQPVLPWIFGGIFLTAALRLGSIFLLERKPRLIPSPAGRHLVFLTGSILVALAFSALNIIMVPRLDSIQVALLCMSAAGVNSVAVQSMAGSPVAFALYMLPNMGSLLGMVARYPIRDHQGVMLVLLAVYITALLATSLEVHSSLRRNILLGLKLGDLALRDSLTGLRNRRFLKEFMENEVDRTLRSWSETNVGTLRPKSSITLLMLDLDRFKQVNDTFGHKAGDAVLQQISMILEDTARRPDLVTRWGGEEFVVIAMDAVRSPLQPLAERIRSAVEAHEFRLPNAQIIRCTCSLGFANFPFFELDPEGMTWEQVLNLADGALYLAKQEGRNRVCGVVPGPALPAAPRSLVALGRDLQEPMRDGLLGVVRRTG